MNTTKALALTFLHCTLFSSAILHPSFNPHNTKPDGKKLALLDQLDRLQTKVDTFLAPLRIQKHRVEQLKQQLEQERDLEKRKQLTLQITIAQDAFEKTKAELHEETKLFYIKLASLKTEMNKFINEPKN